MRDLSGDEGVFIRSMASRGSLGGIARKTASVVQVFDAAGYEIIIVETVGAGQSEVDVARLVHTTLVVEAPGLGDEIQAIKAGILEIADVVVINKAVRPGVENTERALRSTLELAHPTKREFRHHGKTMSISEPTGDPSLWIPLVIKTVATEGKGMDLLAEAITKHATHLRESGDWSARDRARLGSEMELLLREALMDRFLEDTPQKDYEEMIQKVASRNISPYDAVQALLNGSPKRDGR
jgi:LAO/AO transport system kinase